jgi:hypothetical protein
MPEETNREDAIYKIITKLSSVNSISQFTKDKMIGKLANLDDGDLQVMGYIVDKLYNKNRKSPYQQRIASIKSKIAGFKKTGNSSLFVVPVNDTGADIQQRELNNMFRD